MLCTFFVTGTETLFHFKFYAMEKNRNQQGMDQNHSRQSDNSRIDQRDQQQQNVSSDRQQQQQQRDQNSQSGSDWNNYQSRELSDNRDQSSSESNLW